MPEKHKTGPVRQNVEGTDRVKGDRKKGGGRKEIGEGERREGVGERRGIKEKRGGRKVPPVHPVILERLVYNVNCLYHVFRRRIFIITGFAFKH